MPSESISAGVNSCSGFDEASTPLWINLDWRATAFVNGTAFPALNFLKI